MRRLVLLAALLCTTTPLFAQEVTPDTVLIEAVRSRGFIRAAETQLTKVINLLNLLIEQNETPTDTVPTPEEPADTTEAPGEPPDTTTAPSQDTTWTHRLNGSFEGTVVVPEGERWLVEQASIRGNLVVNGVLGFRPGSALHFVGAHRDQYVGGGMTFVESDWGLWVLNNGVLDIQCTPKKGWNRTGYDSTWSVGDELWITPTNPGDFEPRRWYPGDPIPRAHDLVPAAEIINVTRDCIITGPGHIWIKSSQPQRIEYVRLERMGIAQHNSQNDLVTSRYALHFHWARDGSRGSIVRGVAAVNSEGTVFVPHASHGITFEDIVSVNSYGPAFWWDHGDLTFDLSVEGCAFTGVYLPRDVSGRTSFVNGVELMFGERMSMNNCVVSGVRGSTDSHGFLWPEHPNCNCEKSVWEFKNNVAHNNEGDGVRFWVNDADPHEVHDLIVYRNGDYGIENGAYLNAVRYFNTVIVEDELTHKSSARLVDDNGPPSGHYGLTVVNPSGPQIRLGNAAIPPIGVRTEFENCQLTGPSPKVVVMPNESPIYVKFKNCGITPSDIRWEERRNGSSILIEQDGQPTVEVYVEGGQVRTRTVN